MFMSSLKNLIIFQTFVDNIFFINAERSNAKQQKEKYNTVVQYIKLYLIPAYSSPLFASKQLSMHKCCPFRDKYSFLLGILEKKVLISCRVITARGNGAQRP